MLWRESEPYRGETNVSTLQQWPFFMNLLKFGKSSSRHHAWSFIVRGGAFLAGTLSSFSISQTCDTQCRQKRQASPPGMFSTKWGVMRLRDMQPMIGFSIFWAMYTIVTIIYGDINQYIPLLSWALHEFVMVTMGDTTKKKKAKIGNIPRWRSPHDPTAVFDLWPMANNISAKDIRGLSGGALDADPFTILLGWSVASKFGLCGFTCLLEARNRSWQMVPVPMAEAFSIAVPIAVR